MDSSYLLLIQSLREACGGIFNSLMLNITSLGTPLLTYLLLAAIYWCVNKQAGQLMAMNVSIAYTLNQFMKAVFKIERPWVQDSRIEPVPAALSHAGGYSFPSGHTTRATAIWGPLGASLWRQKEKIVSMFCWVVVLAVAFSRNYLGVHTLKDVLAALIIGIVLVILFEKVLSWVEKGKNRDIIVAAIGCLICFLPMLKVGCLSNAGAGMGFLIGWVLERHFINFDTSGSGQEKCVRFAVGGTGVVFIISVLQSLLNQIMAAKYAGFFTMFLLGLFVMAVYPFFFCKRERYKSGIALLFALLIGITSFSFAWQQHLQNLAGEAEESEVVLEENGGGAVEILSDNGTEGVLENDDEDMILQLPAIIAHRGYSSVFPENTLAAFAGALDIGVDYIELDVQLTKDGQVVIFHDDSLKRITGTEGAVSDYTYEELLQMDAGSWFSASFAGEKIPTLQEVLELVKDTDCKIYLELKDIGEVKGFEADVLDVTEQCGMTQRCVFASFQYNYLTHLKELDESLLTLYNTTSGKATLPQEFPADYYGLYTETITADTVDAIHRAGKQAFVWTVNTPQQMQNVQSMGVDGIVTNYPGMAKVLRQPEYSYLTEHYESSVTMPGLYEPDISAECEDMIVQGLTKAGNYLAVSAYSKSGEKNSILYVMNLSGKLQKIVDLGFKAHTGGIAYDELHDLLWVTGPEGKVYAVSWSGILAGTYQGEIQVSFDAGLVNHNGSKVASFLTLFENELFVGSYVDGAGGILNRYDLSDVQNPGLLSVVEIPERIQGITFKRDVQAGECYMFLSQGYQTEDSSMLKFVYDEQTSLYAEPLESHVLPEGVEQIQMTSSGIYILFESAVRPYRATARIPNDQIYLIRE